MSIYTYLIGVSPVEMNELDLNLVPQSIYVLLLLKVASTYSDWSKC